jgi:DNA primase
MNTWVDFRQIKERVAFPDVLAHYNLKLTGKGRELTGRCPFHKDTKPSFRINLDKRVFHCFGCGAKGNVLEFVAAMEKVSLRDAALKLQEWFGTNGGESSPPPLVSDHPTAPTRRDNQPLTFALKGIDPGHPYLAQRGISRSLAESFGVGFFPGKGSMNGRIVIPIHNETGDLVAYAGRAIDDSEPRYKLPAGFQKSLVLFNLHRVTRGDRVIVVEGFFDTLKVVQAGFPDVVALMGTALSPAQERLLNRFQQIVLLLDGDQAGKAASSGLAARLAECHFVRIVAIEGQPDQLSSAEIQAALSQL